MSREPRRGEDSSPARGPNPPNPSDSTDDGTRLGPRWAIVRRELGSLRSEKTIVLALAIQLLVAAFSSFLVVGFVSMYDPGGIDGHETEVAITGTDPDPLLAAAADRDGIAAVDATDHDREDVYRAFDEGRVDVLIDTHRDDDGRLVASVIAPQESIETTVLVVQLQETLEQVELEQRQQRGEHLEQPPLSLPPAVDASPYFGFTYTVLLPLLVLLPVFISGSIAVDSLIEERERGTLALLRVAPPSFSDVVSAKHLAATGLVPIQVAAWLALLTINDIAIDHVVSIVALATAFGATLVAFGLGVALVSPERRQAQLFYSVGVLGGLVLAAMLPEHPANTIAKLAVGNPTGTTWLSLAGYGLLALVAVLALRAGVGRVDASSL